MRKVRPFHVESHEQCTDTRRPPGTKWTADATRAWMIRLHRVQSPFRGRQCSYIAAEDGAFVEQSGTFDPYVEGCHNIAPLGSARTRLVATLQASKIDRRVTSTQLRRNTHCHRFYVGRGLKFGIIPLEVEFSLALDLTGSHAWYCIFIRRHNILC